jgi:uncharacterized protein with HEPN domain
MKREIKKYLFDIKTSIDSIFDFLGEKRDFFEYQNNKLLRRGVEREIEIIGEAMNRILRFDPSFKIDNARQIVDTRNWVIHGYDKVDDVIILNTHSFLGFSLFLFSFLSVKILNRN